MENLVICNGSSTSSRLKRVRCSSVVLGMCNMAVIILSALVVISASPDCSGTVIFSFVLVMVSGILRIMSMIGTGIAQEATASAILNSPSTSDDAVIRHERRTRYKRWLWWTRFGLGIYVIQFLGATYLMFIVVKYITQNGKSGKCFSGSDPYGNGWDRSILVLLIIILWFLVTFQCVAGSDVLRWRSFYATHDNAWKAHYRELFDYGIRETLCCLGRGKYLSVLEEDEVYSVAQLLGDLVAYRASGTGHLELLAGLALLQRHRQAASSHDEFTEAPEEQIGEAAVFHPFAEAAYTGPLLDFGRNPILFPCAWLYRQGVLTPWTRKRRPVLEGDNWWRGHAAAFLKYVNQSPETLRRGRVSQAKCQAAYFVVVLHHLRSIVISVRGTETPEDLITDGLCRESTLSVDDLDGLINSDHLDLNVKQRVISSFPHYGHSGIVEAARELFVQVDGQPGDCDAPGFLSSLVASGHECDGYNIRIVGHSLGGAIATLLGLRLYRRYPNLHVYSYGSLPCVDSIVAAACSDFVTSIVYGDEFSSRLSVNSITRLRAAAITALSQDSSADSAMICKLARRVLYINKYCMKKGEAVSAPFQSGTMTTEDGNHMYERHCKHAIKGCNEQDHEFPSLEDTEITYSEDASILRANSNEVGFSNVPNSFSYACFETANDVLSCNDPVAEFMHAIPSSNQPSVGDPPEMFLPGLVIHIVRQQRSLLPSWKSWRVGEREHGYRAYGANREHFKDIIVSPYMFLDHLPWRCHYAMQKVLEVQKGQGQHREMV